MKQKQWENIEGRVNLAGVLWSDYQKLEPRVLKAGLVLKLIGEPSNVYDKYAIRVEYAGYFLGYIPQGTIHQSELWNANRNGYKCIAVLTAFNKTNPTWSMITIQLKRKSGVIKRVPTEIEL